MASRRVRSSPSSMGRREPFFDGDALVLPVSPLSPETIRHRGNEVLRKAQRHADIVAREWQNAIDRGRQAASGFSCNITASTLHAERAENEVDFSELAPLEAREDADPVQAYR